MARDPGSVRAPLVEAGGPDGLTKTQVIVHSTGTLAPAAANRAYFERGDVAVESTFVVGVRGRRRVRLARHARRPRPVDQRAGQDCPGGRRIAQLLDTVFPAVFAGTPTTPEDPLRALSDAEQQAAIARLTAAVERLAAAPQPPAG